MRAGRGLPVYQVRLNTLYHGNHTTCAHLCAPQAHTGTHTRNHTRAHTHTHAHAHTHTRTHAPLQGGRCTADRHQQGGPGNNGGRNGPAVRGSGPGAVPGAAEARCCQAACPLICSLRPCFCPWVVGSELAQRQWASLLLVCLHCSTSPVLRMHDGILA